VPVGKLALIFGVAAATIAAQPEQADQLNLAKALADGKLRPVNRAVSKAPDRADGVHVSARANPGIAWIEGTDFGEGAIEVQVRGRDVYQQSFVGIAFHGKDDNTYEAVYLRPFNFRAEDPARHRHAVQYMMVPDFDWPKLREQFPDEFESAVSAAVAPTDWVTLRLAVRGKTVDVWVGLNKTPIFSARKLGNLDRGMIGLWTGNGSDGDFADLRITRRK
jgi:hypothetical protein